MLMKKNAVISLFAAVLLAALAPGPAVASGGPTIVGSWEAVSTLDTGEEAPGLFTFNIDRTWIASANEVAFSNAHGAWKRTGRRTYTGTSKGFIFGADGTISLLVTNEVDIRVSRDGRSFEATFLTSISLPDGSVIDSFGGTATGTRILP